MDPLTLQSVGSLPPGTRQNRLTDLRWGEPIAALKPRHLDFIKRTLKVEETVVAMSIENSPTDARMLTKSYPKDNEARPEQDSRPTRAPPGVSTPTSAPACSSNGDIT